MVSSADTERLRQCEQTYGRRAAERAAYALLRDRDNVEFGILDFVAQYGADDASPALFDHLGVSGSLYDPHAAVKLASEIVGEEVAHRWRDELAECSDEQRTVIAKCLNSREAFAAAPMKTKKYLRTLNDADTVAIWVILFARLPVPCRPSSGNVEGMATAQAPAREADMSELCARLLGLSDVDFTSDAFKALVAEDDE